MIRSLHWDDCKKSNAKNFWKIAYPASLEGLLLVLLSSVDLIMISSLGVEATSAVGIFSQPKMVLLCLPRSFAVAVTAHIAALYGGGKKQDIPFCMKQALVLIAIAGGILIGIAFLLLQPILLLAGAQKEYLALAMTYSKLVVISLYFSSLSIVLHAGLMAVGKSGIMMISNVLGNIVNVCINALLIHGIGFFPKMGVKGAALGTFIGAFVTLLFTLAVVLKKENIVHSAGMTALLDTCASMLAGFAIIPAVFAFGMDPASGPPLMFITIPKIFGLMPMGELFGAFFFLSVLFAGVTSLINLFEVCSEAIQSRAKVKRIPSIILIAAVVFAVGVFLEYEPYMGKWMDMITIYVVPIGAVLGAIMIYWVLGKEKIGAELNLGRKKPLGNGFFWIAKYFYVLLAGAVVILSIIYGGIG